MDISILLGLLIGFGSIVIAFILEGGHLTALLGLSAALIVFGGTFGALMISFPQNKIKVFPKAFIIAFKKRKSDIVEKILFYHNTLISARKNGLLTIEERLANNTELDSFGIKGLQMALDGMDPDVIRKSLESKVVAIDERHREYASMFEAAGGYSPTMGIIGTVTGLIHVLGNMSDPNSLAPKIALAFIATLYGVGFANLLWLPIANKLKTLNNEEIREREIEIEAIILIQEGVNPNVMLSKLESTLTEKEVLELRSNRQEVV